MRTSLSYISYSPEVSTSIVIVRNDPGVINGNQEELDPYKLVLLTNITMMQIELIEALSNRI